MRLQEAAAVQPSIVMAVLVTAIHVLWAMPQGVDGRDSACGRPGHDEPQVSRKQALPAGRAA
jgi:hypothetical protein